MHGPDRTRRIPCSFPRTRPARRGLILAPHVPYTDAEGAGGAPIYTTCTPSAVYGAHRGTHARTSGNRTRRRFHVASNRGYGGSTFCLPTVAAGAWPVRWCGSHGAAGPARRGASPGAGGSALAVRALSRFPGRRRPVAIADGRPATPCRGCRVLARSQVVGAVPGKAVHGCSGKVHGRSGKVHGRSGIYCHAIVQHGRRMPARERAPRAAGAVLMARGRTGRHG